MIGKPRVGSVVGPATIIHWGQVLHLPDAYGVVEVLFPDGGAREHGIHVLSELSARLIDVPMSLKALKKIVESVYAEGVETILLCVPVGNVIYVALRGYGDVYLRRGRQFARLLHESGFISGEVQPADTIILASGEFSRALPADEAGAVFDHLSPEEVAERLTLLLHEKPHGEGSSALVLQFGEEEITEEKPVAQVTFISKLLRHPKKKTFLLTAALITLFVIAVVLGIWKQSGTGASPAVVAAVASAQHDLTEGVALLPLNPTQGRQRLQDAKQLLDPLLKSVPPGSSEGRTIADLSRQVNDNFTQSMQIVHTQPQLFFDAALVKKGGTITSIGLEDTTMSLADAATGTVYALDVTSKKATVLGGGSAYSGLTYTAVHGTNVFVLVPSGVNAVSLVDNSTMPLVVKKDPQWGTISALVSFAGNLYMLDTQKSRIWKYVATDTGFSDLKEYLNPDTLPDLSSTNSLSIDGSVWLGSTNGKIWKFTGGKIDTYYPQGVDPAFGNNLFLYTSDSVNNIYVLDADNTRVVVLQKDGTYLSQYVWSGAFHPTQMIVSEDEKKIYLLAGGKLYAIDLK